MARVIKFLFIPMIVLAFLAAGALLAIPRLVIVTPLPSESSAASGIGGADTRVKRAAALLAVLAGDIGIRHTDLPEKLAAARRYLTGELASLNLRTSEQEFEAPSPTGPQKVANLIADTSSNGNGELILVVANYDSMQASPGADTNASGVVATLLAAERVGRWEGGTKRRVRFLLTVNKEPPHFGEASMGSAVYARAAKAAGEKIKAVINVQSVGIFSDAKGSQSYPSPLSLFLPDVGNFVAVVGDMDSSLLAKQVADAVNTAAESPRAVGVALPRSVPGVDWSDHRSFWNDGYPAVMISDTALYRNKGFAKPEDTPDKISLTYLVGVAMGIEAAVKALDDAP